MRRFLALIAIPLLACVVLAGCGSSKSSSSSSPASSTSSAAAAASASTGSVSGTGANTSVTAIGAFGKAPAVTIPKALPGSSLTVKTLIQGTGSAVTKSDAVAANFVLYFWQGKSSSLKASTYTSSPTVIGGQMLPGLETALVGKKVGSRVLAVIPPAQGYGTAGNSQIGVTGSTWLVFVIDVVKSYADTAGATGAQVSDGGGNLPTVSVKAGAAPSLSFPSGAPPSTLVTKTLVKGNGPKVAKGEYIIAQYVGYIWRTKKVFGSSWSSGSPFGFVVGATPEQVIPGWDKGLTGQTVGSRVLLSIPPAEGYGTAGASQAGIKGTDTLVFVVDILDALKQG
jgi:FKBP-type peptidyl-prolyl cis-trans isomerase